MKLIRSIVYFATFTLGISTMSFAAAAVSSQATAGPSQGVPPLYLGAAWYPEQWPESRWDADLTLMQQAEFAWCASANLPGAAWSRARANTISTGWIGRSLLPRNT